MSKPKLFRCLADECGREFESDSPACVACGGGAVVELVPVHYLVIDPEGPIGTGLGRRRIACMPLRAKLVQCSGERVAVTCPRCKASPLFAQHEAAEVDQHVPEAERRIAEEHGVTPVQG